MYVCMYVCMYRTSCCCKSSGVELVFGGKSSGCCLYIVQLWFDTLGLPFCPFVFGERYIHVYVFHLPTTEGPGRDADETASTEQPLALVQQMNGIDLGPPNARTVQATWVVCKVSSSARQAFGSTERGKPDGLMCSSDTI